MKSLLSFAAAFCLFALPAIANPPGVETTSSFPFALMQPFPRTMEKIFDHLVWQSSHQDQQYFFKIKMPNKEGVESAQCWIEFTLHVTVEADDERVHRYLTGTCAQRQVKLRLSAPKDLSLTPIEFASGTWVNRLDSLENYEIEVQKQGAHYIVRRVKNVDQDFSEFRSLHDGSSVRFSNSLNPDTRLRTFEILGYQSSAITFHYHILWLDREGRLPAYQYFNRMTGVKVELRDFQKEYQRNIFLLSFSLLLDVLF